MKPKVVFSIDEINLSDLDFWREPLEVREAAFETLRRERPVAFMEEMDYGFLPAGPGYYAVSTYRDVVEASRRPDIFSSAKGATSIPDLPTPFLEYFGGMINVDDPRHARLRRIVLRAFTPRRLDAIEAQIATVASQLADKAIELGTFDLVAEVASQLPLTIICEMMGIPLSKRQEVLEKSNVILGVGDPEFVPEGEDIGMTLLTAGFELSELMKNLAQERIDDPMDDITSALVNAEVDGEALTPDELASFFILLVVAGNETTRNAITWGVELLSQYPRQKELWMSDFDRFTPSAIEEIVRFASPVIFMRRTLTQPYELSGVTLAKDDKVILMYGSANKDHEEFEDPYDFRVDRMNNKHVGFGGYGPHYCLGAHLARREITLIFKEIFGRIPNLHPVSPPSRLTSSFINGIKHLEVSVV
ncbi:cytochrome P450 [Acidithrix ferrooxidans]|uniref:Putative cytochrome P450 124 n=1 Tax=Acidithrix ferrooxidans TaxID=1280514 RepID=A0A0D8HML0_9ACTN|nr:cytochrome P450 [Acidithrix ferrooxidans]KJF19089.1 putative cytochrome P450 124 [Acidithrix ferrooxidans]